MIVKVLVENTKRNDIKGIKASHGLSLYIESNNKKIILDLGGSNLFIKNAIAMGISIEDIDILVISHSHLDHIGGLESFLKVNSKAKVYLHEEVKQDFIAMIFGFLPLKISINPNVYKEFSDRFTFIDKDYEIVPNINLITNFIKDFPEPPSNCSLYVIKERIKERDNFTHEIALAITENDRVNLFSSCSHSGIFNIIETGKKRMKQNITNVFGGFHLSNPVPGRGVNKDYINKLGDSLYNQKNTSYFTCHCTGEKNYKLLKETLKDRITKISTGDTITV